MGRLALGAALACAAGCAQLFGIQNTTGGDAGADAPPPGVVSLRVQRMSIGATVVSAPQDLTGQTASYEVPDSTTPSGMRAVPAMVASAGLWTAPIPMGTPPVLYTLPDFPMQTTRFYALPGRSFAALYGWLEHPNPAPAPTGAMINVNVNTGAAQAGNETYNFYTVGSWTSRAVTAPAVGTSQINDSFPFDQPNVSITGRPVEKITSDDAVLVLRYVGNQLTGFYRAPPFDQTGNDTIAGTMTQVTPDTTLAMTIHPDAVAARYANVRPAVANLGMAYYIDAAPGYLVANNNGPQLDAVGVAATDSGTVSHMFANPFSGNGWNTIVVWVTNESRTYTVAGLPVTAYAGMNEFVEPGTGLDLLLDAGLPTSISLNQMPLLTDGMTIAIDPTKSVDLNFVPDMPGATLSQIQLFELVPNAANTAQQYVFRFSCSGTDPHFVVPAGAFVSGHTYVLRAISNKGGFPGVASGDLTMRSLPLVQAYADSGVFTVQ
jgi:hypothetical protein